MRLGFIRSIFGRKKRKSTSHKKNSRQNRKETRKRPIIDPITRRKVLERAGGKCEMCGVKEKDTPEGYLEMDHKRPFSEMGSTTLHNLQALCKKCNQEKGNKWRNLKGEWQGHSYKIPKEK